MSPELQKKVGRAVKLIQSAGRDGQVVEVAYSGGKDSDVILELAKMSGINYRAIYRNTTIDPPGTIAHVKEKGVEILRPKKTFFQIVEYAGFPNRYMRFCCRYLKEYKVLDRCIMGVRRAESAKRAANIPSLRNVGITAVRRSMLKPSTQYSIGLMRTWWNSFWRGG